MNDATPLSYAKSIAYLSNASTIRARVKDLFGTAPDMAAIERMIAKRKPKPVAPEFDECGHKRDEANTFWDGASAVCRRCYNARKRALERWKRSREKREREALKAVPAITVPPYKPSMDNIIRAAAIASNFTEAQIIGKARHRELVEVRFVIYHLAHKYGFSSPQTGRPLVRDHSTVLNGIKQARYLIEHDPVFRGLVNRTERKLAQIAPKPTNVTVTFDMAA